MKKRGFKAFLIGIIILAGFSGIVMLLWNLVIPGIFGLSAINFWQALGIFILSRILFSGFGASRFMMGRMSQHHQNNHFREKWKKMTPEEQREFINRRREFGFGGPFRRDGFCKERNADHGKENE